MPAGKKQCPKCNLWYGTRQLKCTCGHIFIKKTNYTNIKQNLKPKKKRIDYTILFTEVDDELEQKLRQKYYPESACWESLDNLYRVRYTPVVYGTNFTLSSGYGPYITLYKNNNEWKILRITNSHTGRFFNKNNAMKACIIYQKRLEKNKNEQT